MIFNKKQIQKLSSYNCQQVELIFMLNEECNADCDTCILKQNIYNKNLCQSCLLYNANQHNNCYQGHITDDLYIKKVIFLLELFCYNKSIDKINLNIMK